MATLLPELPVPKTLPGLLSIQTSTDDALLELHVIVDEQVVWPKGIEQVVGLAAILPEGTGVGVIVMVLVGVGVLVFVGVGEPVLVGVGVGPDVGVIVGVCVAVGIGVAEGTSISETSPLGKTAIAKAKPVWISSTTKLA